MNDLCADIGYKSINHYGEQLCGDHVDVVETGDDSTVIVLSDGLGSGVKASILSTLTSKIISTMLSEGLSLEECVKTNLCFSTSSFNLSNCTSTESICLNCKLLG